MARMPHPPAYAAQLRDAIEDFGREALASLESGQHGNTCWNWLKLLITAVLMSWHEGQTLTGRFEHVREILAAMFPGWSAPASYTGYTSALMRGINTILSALTPVLQRRVRRMAGRRWKLAGWIVFAVDGSRFESPRTLANEQGLGCAGKHKTAPQVFQTLLLHLGTNAIWDFRCGPGTDSERRHLEEMATDLPEGSLVTADAGFIGYELCQRLRQCGVSFLLRVGGNITLLAEQLSARVQPEGQLVWLWPNGHSQSPPCVLRLFRLKRGRQELFLVTNVLDAQRLNQSQAEEIYRRRWGIEVTYRSIKQTLNRPVCLSRTPLTVLAEHQSNVLGFWVLQVVGLEELRRRKTDPRTWSPAQSRDAARRAIRLSLRLTPSHSSSLREQLGLAVQDSYVRQGSKQSRDWPHQKRDPPVQPPHLRHLTPHQRRAGLQLLKSS